MRVVNHNKKFIYYIVPKSASCSILQWHFEVLGVNANPLIHKYISDHREVFCPTFEVVNNPDYYQFSFIRNPWKRLVSSYLQKIVVRNEDRRLKLEIGKKAIAEIQQRNNEPVDFVKGVTFFDFVEYVCGHRLDKIDWENIHWMPQINVLQNPVFQKRIDFLGIVENIDAEMQWLQKRLNTDTELPRINTMNYAQTSNECVSEFSASTLRKIDPFPYYEDFYNPDLIEMVGHIYKEDIELYDALQKRELHQRGFPLE